MTITLFFVTCGIINGFAIDMYYRLVSGIENAINELKAHKESNEQNLHERYLLASNKILENTEQDTSIEDLTAAVTISTVIQVDDQVFNESYKYLYTRMIGYNIGMWLSMFVWMFDFSIILTINNSEVIDFVNRHNIAIPLMQLVGIGMFCTFWRNPDREPYYEVIDIDKTISEVEDMPLIDKEGQ